jgi:CRISPR system Cascade subunit CasD
MDEGGGGMTYTLLIRLTGPMQAWGLQSRFSHRDTAREPTKSGVIGLVAAALGRAREADISDLAALRFGVRVDREGQLRRDFHTAMDVLVASASMSSLERGKPKLKDTEPSERFFLADAWFTVGLESGDRGLLERIDAALASPNWALFLGRQGMAPGLPPRIVSRDDRAPAILAAPLFEALIDGRDPLRRDQRENELRFVLDADAAPASGFETVTRRMQPDHPVSFRPRHFLPRDVVVGYSRT